MGTTDLSRSMVHLEVSLGGWAGRRHALSCAQCNTGLVTREAIITPLCVLLLLLLLLPLQLF